MNDIREYIKYDPVTGYFTWIKWNGSPRAVIGKRAGSKDAEGYWRVKFDGKVYKGSRLAFFFMTGRWPKDMMDHINRVRDDNRWENLREADRSINMKNRGCWHKSEFWYKHCKVCNPAKRKDE